MLPFSLALPFAAKALETLERPDSRHQGKYSTLPSGFAFVHPKQCDLQWVPPTSPPPPAQVPMTRQKAPWARRAGAGWGPGGERRHTPSGGKPVPARWGVRGGGGAGREWPSHTKTRVHDASASSRKRVPPVGARSGARKCAPPGRRCPRSERHFFIFIFWRSRRANEPRGGGRQSRAGAGIGASRRLSCCACRPAGEPPRRSLPRPGEVGGWRWRAAEAKATGRPAG